ncbi:hypothetical protein GA0070558_118133 [Micromonospora haikouensis]|uniref:Uncharacterized protein n=1 Tax=Micromonospora haikouensis TaxID=686309 RepID=A0A1C4WUU6_9ACTN|nr:hypothetical protein GA0070558_118133 [Micromonospora haikouensis]
MRFRLIPWDLVLVCVVFVALSLAAFHACRMVA